MRRAVAYNAYLAAGNIYDSDSDPLRTLMCYADSPRGRPFVLVAAGLTNAGLRAASFVFDPGGCVVVRVCIGVTGLEAAPEVCLVLVVAHRPVGEPAA